MQCEALWADPSRAVIRVPASCSAAAAVPQAKQADGPAFDQWSNWLNGSQICLPVVKRIDQWSNGSTGGQTDGPRQAAPSAKRGAPPSTAAVTSESRGSGPHPATRRIDPARARAAGGGAEGGAGGMLARSI